MATKWLSPSNRIFRVIAMTDGATITPNADTTDIGTVTLGGNRTMAAPTGTLLDGQQLTFRIKQDATGSRTLTWNSIYSFPGGSAPVLSTTTNALDVIGFSYNAASSKWECMAMQLADSNSTAATQDYVNTAITNYNAARPIFAARMDRSGSGSTYTLPGGVGTLNPLPLNAEDFDSHGGHDTVTNNERYTPQIAGYYAVVGSGFWNTAPSATYRKLILRKNGSTTIPGTQSLIFASTAGLFGQAAPLAISFFNGTSDYVELCADAGTASSVMFANATDGPMLVSWRVA